MPRLNVVSPEKATGKTQDLYAAITRAVGAVPNLYQGVANSPAALAAELGIGEALRSGKLSPAEVETVKLVVSQAYDCTYCQAAHTLLGKKAGLSEGETILIRKGAASTPKASALVAFTQALLQPAARLTDEQLQALRAAGYSDAQITEIVLVIAQTVFTNLFNRVHQTPLDFPAAPSL